MTVVRMVRCTFSPPPIRLYPAATTPSRFKLTRTGLFCKQEATGRLTHSRNPVLNMCFTMYFTVGVIHFVSLVPHFKSATDLTAARFGRCHVHARRFVRVRTFVPGPFEQ